MNLYFWATVDVGSAFALAQTWRIDTTYRRVYGKDNKGTRFHSSTGIAHPIRLKEHTGVCVCVCSSIEHSRLYSVNYNCECSLPCCHSFDIITCSKVPFHFVFEHHMAGADTGFSEGGGGGGDGHKGGGWSGVIAPVGEKLLFEHTKFSATRGGVITPTTTPPVSATAWATHPGLLLHKFTHNHIPSGLLALSITN